MSARLAAAHRRRPWPVGLSARGGSHPDGPLRHAATRAPASKWGHNVRAVCGTSIRPEGDWVNQPVAGQDFTGSHPRDCRRCARALSS